MAFSANTGDAVTETEHRWIPMPDGVRLAARIWWPPGAGPFPALFEYIPYRKSDLARARDERNHPFFAARGYACLRIDMRGSGDSEGHMPDMYSEDELADARHVIRWLAAQDWCTGCVGMFGTSWGGTASLQAAVGAPDALKAVIANCATANRFEDDIHWMGGALLTDSFEWGTTLPAILAAPPDAAALGDDWRRIWRARLDKLAFPLDNWIRHCTRGAYWRHGSVKFNADQLSCPILAIGGWADRYSNTVMELVQARPETCWGIVGPWGHHYPDQGEPGPAIGFQEVALAWWEHWLKDGGANAPLNWPRLRLWRREFEPPQEQLDTRNGEWVETATTGQTHARAFYPTAAGLSDQPGDETLSFEVPHDWRHGECAGDTGYFGRAGGLPAEQSADDARALCFDSMPLAEDFDLIGCAEFSCDITREQAEAQLACRLCEMAPDGRSLLVTRQVLNLALDETMDAVSPFVAGEPVRIRLRLPSTAYRFTRGNRIRLALGASYWPLVRPAPHPASIRVLTQHARLSLPRPERTAPLSTPFPEAGDWPARRSWEMETEGPMQRERKPLHDARVYSSWRLPPVTLRYLETGVSVSFGTAARYDADMTGSGATACAIDHAIEITRPDGKAEIQSSLVAEAKSGRMTVDATLCVKWNETGVAEKAWRHVYPADEETKHARRPLRVAGRVPVSDERGKPQA